MTRSLTTWGDVLCHSASLGQLVVVRPKQVNQQTGTDWQKLLSWPAAGAEILVQTSTVIVLVSGPGRDRGTGQDRADNSIRANPHLSAATPLNNQHQTDLPAQRSGDMVLQETDRLTIIAEDRSSSSMVPVASYRWRRARGDRVMDVGRAEWA